MQTINRAGSVSKTSDTWRKYRYLPPTRKYQQYPYLVSVSCPSLVPSKTVSTSRMLVMSLNNYLAFLWAHLEMIQRDLNVFGTSRCYQRNLVWRRFRCMPSGTVKTSQTMACVMRDLDPVLEERASNKCELTGAFIDSFLKEIGRSLYFKLGRSRNTGLMPPVKLFVPYTIFRLIIHFIVFSILIG